MTITLPPRRLACLAELLAAIPRPKSGSPSTNGSGSLGSYGPWPSRCRARGVFSATCKPLSLPSNTVDCGSTPASTLPSTTSDGSISTWGPGPLVSSSWWYLPPPHCLAHTTPPALERAASYSPTPPSYHGPRGRDKGAVPSNHPVIPKNKELKAGRRTGD
jgi:hypothetical protein